jgi:hypothetical protein
MVVGRDRETVFVHVEIIYETSDRLDNVGNDQLIVVRYCKSAVA